MGMAERLAARAYEAAKVERQERPFEFRPVVKIRGPVEPAEVYLYARHEGGEFLASMQVAFPQQYEWQWDRYVNLLKVCCETDLRWLGWHCEGTLPTEYEMAEAAS